MTPKNGHRPLIPYIRQSRAKEKTISLEEQRRIIGAWAKANKVELAQEVVEQGVSGSKDWRERALGDAMQAVEGGEAQGIVVAFQDRLSRENGLATAEVWQALEHAEARLVCAGEGLDTATGDHEMLFSIKAAIAREQWKRHRANWEAARRNAVERGVHVTSTLPAGYDRDPETGKLVPNEHAPTVTEAFERRARGASWTEVAKFLTDAGVRTSHKGRKHRGGNGTDNDGTWTAKSALKVLSNRVYLGESRSGEFINKDAHPALVTPGLWARVQGRKQKGDFAKTDTDRALLAGLARCATCGGPLIKDSTRRNGKVYPFYRCKNQKGCTGKATIGRDKLDRYVVEQVLTHAVWPPIAPRPEGQSKDYQEALERVDKAVEALDEWAATWQASGLSPATAAQMAAGLERERDEAVEVLNALPVAPSEDTFWKEVEERGYDVEAAKASFARVTEGPFSAAGLLDVYEVLPKDFKRKILRRALESVTVKPGRGSAEERVTVSLRKGLYP